MLGYHTFAGVTVGPTELVQPNPKAPMRPIKYPIAECYAEVDQGANVAARMTATRVAVGTLLAPGVGTLIGALAKKNRNKVYLAIATPGEPILLEVDSKKEGKAREFAMRINGYAAKARGER